MSQIDLDSVRKKILEASSEKVVSEESSPGLDESAAAISADTEGIAESLERIATSLENLHELFQTVLHDYMDRHAGEL